MNASGPERALQLWQILISKADNRQTMTYISLAKMAGYSDARPMMQILGYIMDYCQKEGLPPLTILVVNKATGEPGGGLSTVNQLNQDRENVFNYDWYGVFPPSADEFRDASAK